MNVSVTTPVPTGSAEAKVQVTVLSPSSIDVAAPTPSKLAVWTLSSLACSVIDLTGSVTATVMATVPSNSCSWIRSDKSSLYEIGSMVGGSTIRLSSLGGATCESQFFCGLPHRQRAAKAKASIIRRACEVFGW